MIDDEAERGAEVPPPPAAHAIDLVKTYGTGDAVVHALERGHRRVRARALHGGHGAVGIRQVHPHALYGRP